MSILNLGYRRQCDVNIALLGSLVLTTGLLDPGGEEQPTNCRMAAWCSATRVSDASNASCLNVETQDQSRFQIWSVQEAAFMAAVSQLIGGRTSLRSQQIRNLELEMDTMSNVDVWLSIAP